MKLEVGQKVKLDIKCRETESAWGLNDEMEDMRGTIQTISRIDRNNLVKLRGSSYSWHVADMQGIATAPKIEINKKPEYFDLKNLCEKR